MSFKYVSSCYINEALAFVFDWVKILLVFCLLFILFILLFSLASYIIHEGRINSFSSFSSFIISSDPESNSFKFILSLVLSLWLTARWRVRNSTFLLPFFDPEHKFGEWHYATSSKYRVCTICGYTEEEYDSTYFCQNEQGQDEEDTGAWTSWDYH
ncbi:MAG: hypothetical protein N838_33015 [Thiohalocapsa sp. PB-PSB1]|jgi:hypothetical protein|nr:MAG: hypothetical protein N838_33015 [Thiohalocapsa sp. PB-PSB1]